MSDEHDPIEAADPELDPEQERVRRLLAEVRHDAPIPAEVAARLDAAVARLVDERRESSSREASRADELADRRRRKRWTTALVAAAAVVVVGVAAPNLDLVVGGGSDSGGDAATSANDEPQSSSDREFSESGNAEENDSGSAGGSAGEPPSSPPAAADLSAYALVEESTFREDAVAARSQAVTESTAPLDARVVACGDVPAAAEQVVLVRYVTQSGEQPGYLVFEPAADPGRQLVTLYVCPGGVPVRSAEVPGP